MRTGFKRTQRKRVAQPRSPRLPLITPTPPGRLSPRWEAPPPIVLPIARGEPTSIVVDSTGLRPAESSRRDTLQLYFREIGQVKLLTPEIVLAERIKRGDKLAREQMIKANLRLVVKIARDYENLGLPLLDLISEGNIGLIKGVERFDPGKGAKLSTYAAWWIRQTIRRALDNQSRTIRLPVHVADKVASIHRAETTLHETLGREPTDEEVADELGIGDARRVRRYREAGRRPVELDAPLETESDSQTASDVVADSNATVPFEHLMKENDRALIRDAFADLNKRESTILVKRFGLDDQTPKTLEEIGRELGVTRERIRQLQAMALKKLRLAMQKRDTLALENRETHAVAVRYSSC